jgi:MoaA/NifB/PqqE/SkfB family radical SAM enzyme
MAPFLDGLRDYVREIGLSNWQQNVNRGINRWERLNSSTHLRSRPLLIEISPTKRCNISCIFCIKYRTKGPKDMSLERYNKIAAMLFPTAVRVSFCTGGDPLINPLMPEFITIADRYDERCCHALRQNAAHGAGGPVF